MPRLPRLPDLLTTANLCCGVASILLASRGQLTIACGLVFLAALFDVLDGLAARALGQGGSEFGKQLDSLADMVSFGVAPGFLIVFSTKPWIEMHWSGWAPLLIPVASAWRLAKFNVDTRQQHGFLGLATPANALFWAAFVLAGTNVGVFDGPGAVAIWGALLFNWNGAVAVPVMVVALCVLMLSNIPLPSLKFKHFRWKGNEVIYCLLLAALCFLLLYGVLAVPLILILYLLSPLWGKLFPNTP